MTNIGQLYDYIMRGPVVGPRGSSTHEVLNAHMQFPANWWYFDIGDLPANVDYIRTELNWYLDGDRSNHSICDAASIWNKCIDSEGLIQSNYGYYYHQQGDKIIDELREDSESRRAVLSIYDHGHLYPNAPDVPCTLTIQFLIRHGLLHAVVNMRSQDAVFGLRNDIAAFQMFKILLANCLDVPPGNLYLNVGSLHVYERHWEKVHDARLQQARWTGFGTVQDLERFLKVRKV